MEYRWRVCPIQGRQLKDVRKEDIYGDFRFCNTYRGGGGYDQFPKIAEKRGLSCNGIMGLQFVAQLHGCPLDCHYCYVTRDGVFGNYVEYTTDELIRAYHRACAKRNAGVFHLMGGAPALQLSHWPELLDKLPEDILFHSDLMLCEREYDLPALRKSNRNNALYAVDIKGVDPEDWYRNTGRKLDERQFWFNFYCVVDSGINFYLVFTNPDEEGLKKFKDFVVERFGDWILDDHFVIDLIYYNALKE